MVELSTTSTCECLWAKCCNAMGKPESVQIDQKSSIMENGEISTFPGRCFPSNAQGGDRYEETNLEWQEPFELWKRTCWRVEWIGFRSTMWKCIDCKFWIIQYEWVALALCWRTAFLRGIVRSVWAILTLGNLFRDRFWNSWIPECTRYSPERISLEFTWSSWDASHSINNDDRRLGAKSAIRPQLTPKATHGSWQKLLFTPSNRNSIAMGLKWGILFRQGKVSFS